MDGDETARNYVRDLGPLLKERALAAKADCDSATGEDRAFASGRLMGFHEVISLLQLQADAFGMDRADVGLADIDPERDLL